MWGMCKIVNFLGCCFQLLWLVEILSTQKKTCIKNGVVFYFVGCLFVGLHILCVKMKTSICEESVLRLNKRNCFPSYQNHYLMRKCCQPKQNDPILEFSWFAIGRVIFGQKHIMCFWFRLNYQPLFGKMWRKSSLLLIWIQEESESMSVSGSDALNTLVTSPHLEKMKKLFNCSSPAVTHLSFVLYLEIS